MVRLVSSRAIENDEDGSRLSVVQRKEAGLDRGLRKVGGHGDVNVVVPVVEYRGIEVQIVDRLFVMDAREVIAREVRIAGGHNVVHVPRRWRHAWRQLGHGTPPLETQISDSFASNFGDIQPGRRAYWATGAAWVISQPSVTPHILYMRLYTCRSPQVKRP